MSKVRLPKENLDLPEGVIIVNGSGGAADLIITGISSGYRWNIQAKQHHSDSGVQQLPIISRLQLTLWDL